MFSPISRTGSVSSEEGEDWPTSPILPVYEKWNWFVLFFVIAIQLKNILWIGQQKQNNRKNIFESMNTFAHAYVCVCVQNLVQTQTHILDSKMRQLITNSKLEARSIILYSPCLPSNKHNKYKWNDFVVYPGINPKRKPKRVNFLN